jgi:hypothetical protein
VFRERFRREDKNVAALDHPHIVTRHDVRVHQANTITALALMGTGRLGNQPRQLPRFPFSRTIDADIIDRLYAAGAAPSC